MKPNRIGRFLETDEHGFLVPDVAAANIREPWRSAVDFVASELVRQGAKAVYLRGSVPRGLAVEGFSDLDFLYFDGPDSEALEGVLEESLAEKFPFVKGVEALQFDEASLRRVFEPQTRPYFQMLLKTQSLFLAGKDLTASIAPFRVDLNPCSHIFTIDKEFAQLSDWLAESDGEEEELKATRRWFFRRLVRAGFEACLSRVSHFTRDLYLCYEDFSRFYPEHEPAMSRALHGAFSGEADPLEEGALVAFIAAEKEKLSAPRPAGS